MNPLVINQPFGLGDILFIQKILESLSTERSILFPIADEYWWAVEYLKIPNVTYIKKSEYNINYEDMTLTDDYIPLRFSTQILYNLNRTDYSKDATVMSDKYMLIGLDPSTWSDYSLTRNTQREEALFEKLEIKDGDKYILVNSNIGSQAVGQHTINLNANSELKTINMNYIEGYTMIDWSKVIENAQELHTSDTGLVWLIDLLGTANITKTIYPRDNGNPLTHTIKLLHPSWIVK